MRGRHGGGKAFGVRRPLRFLARELDLDEEQVSALAAVIDDLKTERAQAQVDHRRAVGEFAAVFAEASFDAERIARATTGRAESAQKVEEAVARALEKTFAVLDAEQRKQLSYLLRAGAVTI